MTDAETQSQAAAWMAVTAALSQLDPSWLRFGHTAQDAAINYINRLHQPIIPAPMINGERAHFETLIAANPPRSMQDAEDYFVFGIQHQMSKKPVAVWELEPQDPRIFTTFPEWRLRWLDRMPHKETLLYAGGQS
jgi:hypothetical protein